MDSRKSGVLIEICSEIMAGEGSRPAGNPQLVEAGGQRFRSFRSGLDYAFIHSAHASEWMRSVLSRWPKPARILVPAQGSAPTASL